MITIGYDENGEAWYINDPRTIKEARMHSFVDKYGIPITPCYYNPPKKSFFRYISEKCNSGGGGPMRPEHYITQIILKRYLENEFPLKVGHWYRTRDGKLHMCKFDVKKYYDTVKIEGYYDGRFADVLLTNSKDPSIPPIMFEVWFRHKCEQNKIDSGNLILEFRVKELEEIPSKLTNLFESWLDKKQPDVRFHNFRERQHELPWIQDYEK